MIAFLTETLYKKELRINNYFFKIPSDLSIGLLMIKKLNRVQILNGLAVRIEFINVLILFIFLLKLFDLKEYDS